MTSEYTHVIVKLVKQVKKSKVQPSFTKVKLNSAAKIGTSRMFVELDCTACSRNAEQFEIAERKSSQNKEAGMAVPYVSRKRLNPRDLDAEGKFYPAPAYIGEIGVNKIAEEISESTTLTPTEVIGVIRSLLLIVPKYLMLGYKVRLDSFGIFKLGLKNADTCKGHEKASEVTANDIEGVRVIYKADSMLSAKLDKPEYVKLDAKYINEETEQTGSGD